MVPGPIDYEILARSENLESGPAVIKSVSLGDTSGRFRVARIGARIFPGARAFVERVRRESISDPKDYVFAPWPSDRIVRLSEFAVSYMTPPGANGLGTAFGLGPRREPVFGLVFLTNVDGGDGPVLEGISVRLDQDNRHLYSAIAVAKIVSMETLPATQAALSGQPGTGALGVVTAFYEALGRGDGVAASERVIPEKRTTGPFSPNAISQFYSHLAEPLHLVSVTRLDDGKVLAQYLYRTSAGKQCDGKAVIGLRLSEGLFLIDSIRALNNC